jgi:hypothetical protein
MTEDRSQMTEDGSGKYMISECEGVDEGIRNKIFFPGGESKLVYGLSLSFDF